MMRAAFLFASSALAFYNVGTIWAHEVDIFRSWQYAAENFATVQAVHWKKLPYWVLAPVVVSLLCAFGLLWYRPNGVPSSAVIVNVTAQTLSAILTGIYWGRWQAALSRDPLGAQSPYLRKILRTHFVRTALITLAACSLLYGCIAATR
jgi:hypothetical protein